MEWKSILVGFLLGALIAIPIGLAHSGFDYNYEKSFRMPVWGMHGGMMDGDMHEEMEAFMESGDFAEMHEEMEKEMEEHMGEGWKEMHEYCERMMGFEKDEE